MQPPAAVRNLQHLLRYSNGSFRCPRSNPRSPHRSFWTASAATEYAAFQSDRWHFSLAVPDGMTAAAHDQAGGGQTIQFLDANGDYQFQVSAEPYWQLDLTLDHIGEPSGTVDQPDHLEIVDLVRDDLFSVHFVKNGIRYTVVSLPEDELWLTDILKSWQFTD